jgi:hypothetical protein
MIFVIVGGLVTDHIADLNGRGLEPQLCSLRLKSEDKIGRACVLVRACIFISGLHVGWVPKFNFTLDPEMSETGPDFNQS